MIVDNVLGKALLNLGLAKLHDILQITHGDIKGKVYLLGAFLLFDDDDLN